MASTLSSTQGDPHFDGGVATMVSKDPFTGVEDVLARLAHQAASNAPDVPPREAASDCSTDAEPKLGAADLRPPVPHKQRSFGKRGIFACVAIAVCLGAPAMWAWRSYGGPARDMIATQATTQTPDPAPAQAAVPPAVETPAPPPTQAASQAALIAQPAMTGVDERGVALAERQQSETMARDLAALRQTVEQLAAGQEELTREIAKLRAEKAPADKPSAEKPDRRTLRRVSAPSAPAVATPARKPAAITPMPPQAAPQVSAVGPPSPPPEPSEPHSSDPPPLRPPMPVPQP
jgi:hypothetical protein